MLRRRRDGAPEGSERWRRRLLEQAGCPPELARAIARDQRYDLHEVLGLLERGCPPQLAIGIAAPLDDREVPR